MDSVAQLQRERDQYAEQIQEEGRVWKDKTEQLLAQVLSFSHTQPHNHSAVIHDSPCGCVVQVTLMSEERDKSAAQIQELQEQIMELKKAAGLHH